MTAAGGPGAAGGTAVARADEARRNEDLVLAENALNGARFVFVVRTGVVAAGMLGGADQHEYTIIGDAVNVASRVEGLTRRLDTDILVTESTWSLAGAGFTGRRLASEPVKGRSEPVVVYALDGG